MGAPCSGAQCAPGQALQGLALSRRYFEEYGAPMLRERFPAWADRLAVGLVGSGSECFGFDDAVSQDHDFEPGFCIFLPEEEVLDRKTEFQLERAYAALPKEYLGFTRPKLSPVGGNRRGVIRLGDFLEARTGSRDGTLSLERWLRLEEQYLSEIVNGELFWTGTGPLSPSGSASPASPPTCAARSWPGTSCSWPRRGSTTTPAVWPTGSPPRPSWPWGNSSGTPSP